MKTPSWILNPVRCGGTDLPMPLPLVAKLLSVCLLGRMVWLSIPAPFLPFLPVLDYFHGSQLFKWILPAIALMGAMAVLFNFRVRAACPVIGASFLLGVLSSRIYFENNVMFLGCV